MKYSYAEYVLPIKALGDETRLRIIDMLSCGEMCACNILEAFDITQPTLSYHMKILTESGLINARRDGAWMRYSLNEEKKNELQIFLEKLMENKKECICKEYL